MRDFKMATYKITNENEIEIDFHGVIPDAETRARMKEVQIWWNPTKQVWHAVQSEARLAVAREICGCTDTTRADYALKVKIRDIIAANKAQLEEWETRLKDHVNGVMGEDNSAHARNAVSVSQESVWINCFEFIASNLSGLDDFEQEFELVFEYSLPGTVHERPDVLLLTDSKVISLEFKRKAAPQLSSNRDDIAQAIRYKEWLQNHHKVTRDRGMDVNSYLVCTHKNAVAGGMRGIEILAGDNFFDVIRRELAGESVCSFSDEWLGSAKTEMPDMLQAIDIMYREGRIPYISDVNESCLKMVLRYIEYAKHNQKKMLIFINGVPGAGKTAVGQSVVFEENKNGDANAVYLSGNGPLVEVLQYQIDLVCGKAHAGENAIQGIKDFKVEYFSSENTEKTNAPQQSVLIFDEAQRAWDAKKLGRGGFSEPEGLLDVGDRIFAENGHAVIVALYGNGQVIGAGEEEGLSLWRDALTKHADWNVIVSSELSDSFPGMGRRKIVDNNMFLPVSLRADFIDCSKWVEQAIGRRAATPQRAKEELAKLQNTSMQILITRDVEKVKAHIREIDENHCEWKYGIFVSNFAVQEIVRKAFPDFEIGYHGKNTVYDGGYGQWFAGGCKRLDKVCSVYGNQGLELDCPIVLFGGEYIRRGGRWVTNGYTYNKRKDSFQNPEEIVENNFRVLLTRARKQMVLLIPQTPILDETYRYFVVDMGMDEL